MELFEKKMLMSIAKRRGVPRRFNTGYSSNSVVTVPEAELFDWGKHDLANKVASALIRGGYVRFEKPEVANEWSGPITAELMDEIDGALVYLGYNLFVADDVDAGVTIAVHSQEY